MGWGGCRLDVRVGVCGRSGVLFAAFSVEEYCN